MEDTGFTLFADVWTACAGFTEVFPFSSLKLLPLFYLPAGWYEQILGKPQVFHLIL
jgi:hypothetical protein